MENISEFLSQKPDFIKTHTCSGRMEKSYSEKLGDYFDAYQNYMCAYLDVGDLSFIDVYKLKFGYLEENTDLFDKLIEYSNSQFEQIGDNITFKSYLCNAGEFRFIIATWDNEEHKSYYPRWNLYCRKKENPNNLICFDQT